MFTKIDELIWSDDKFKELTDDGKLLFIFVLTCSHRNILGLYFLPVPYGAFDLGWETERFTKGLRELLGKGFVNYCFNTNILFVKNFLKYNPLENPNQVKKAMSDLKSIPINGLDAELLEYLETLNKPFMEPLLKQLRERLPKQVDVDVDVYVDIDIDKEVINKNARAREDYVKILDYFCNKANMFQPSANDILTAKKLIAENIPFEIIIYGIDECFKKYKPKYENDKIRALSYCEGSIRKKLKIEQAKAVDIVGEIKPDTGTSAKYPDFDESKYLYKGDGE